MALAAVLGGMAFSNVGVAIVHALEYPLARCCIVRTVPVTDSYSLT